MKLLALDKNKLKNQKYCKNVNNVVILVCLLLNVLLTTVLDRLEIPLYLDCIGTIAATSICGLLPGVIVAVSTNLLCAFINHSSALYYMIINVLIACITDVYVKEKICKKGRVALLAYIASISVMTGILGIIFQVILLGDFQFKDIKDAAEIINISTGIPIILGGIIANTGLNLVDKGFSVLAVRGFMRFVPMETQKALNNTTWKQKPLTKEELNSFNHGDDIGMKSIERKTTLLVILSAIAITLIISTTGMMQYFDVEKQSYIDSAQRTANFAAETLEKYDINEFMQYGVNADGYIEAKEFMYGLRDAESDIKYLYVIKVGRDACYAVMDLESPDTPAYEFGERIEFEEAFGDYLEDLWKGETIEPIESNDISGWIVTAYAPVHDETGKTVCYVGADASVSFLSIFAAQYIIKILLIFSGFLILIIVFSTSYAKNNLVYPINTIVNWTNGFMNGKEDQDELDNAVKELRTYEIKTGDEIETLYKSICKMAVETANQVRDINYFADSTAKMQNGLIITMADMVENRDSDTGAHVQKTAEYVKIISESLKRNGWYLEKLTPKYMSDLVMSAPLHDVGKINISDTILNKPGKLTDEEYEIMKLHTVYGKEIMEKAIVTVKGENYLKEARNMAAYHHERWDGKGYPEGLHGEVIPLSARIMAVADVFDALTSPRVYKPAFPLEKALQILEEGSGTQFDPKCVNAFMSALPEVRQVLIKYQGM